MSDKTTKAADPEVLDEHGDELIHVPTGQSRLRYLATIGLVLFLLVIFVVADLFSNTMTGGGGGSDPVYLRWEDPVDGVPGEVGGMEFQETARMLQMMSAFGVYTPDSYIFGDQDLQRQRRPETTDEDTASFLIYDDVAEDMGVAVSDAEHKEFLKRVFGGKAQFQMALTQTGWTSQLLQDNIRRVLRVQKLRGLMLGMLSIADPNDAVASWSESNPEFKFQIVEVKRDAFEATAEAEMPADEELATWFHERPTVEQQRYYTDQKSVAEVAYLSLDPAGLDATALLEAYPAPEGVDLDGQANSYYSQFRNVRFTVPVEDDAPEEGDPADPADPDDDGEKGDDGEKDGAEAQETPAPEMRVQEFEEVEEQVRAEAPIYAAFRAFLTDAQDQIDAGEAFDLAARAAALGLTFEATSEDGSTREEYAANEAWGDAGLAGQLIFNPVDRFVPRVTVTKKAMVVARVVGKVERVEKPFEEIRDDIAKLWATERSKELAIETLETMRQVFEAKPEDVEAEDWKPTIDAEELRKLAVEAGYVYTDRPWLGRNELPEGQNFSTASAANRFMMTRPDLYDLEPGQVASPGMSGDGESAFLIRFDGKRNKDESEIDFATVSQLRQSAAFERTREFGAQVFLGDGSWLSERAKVRFPYREAEEARRVARKNGSSE